MDHAGAIFFLFLMIFAGIGDFLTFKIPNWLSLFIVGAFFPVAILSGLSFSEILSHTALAVGVLFVGFALFAAGWVGGGDSKLLAAGALWLGPPVLNEFVIYTALAGGGCVFLMKFWNQLSTEIAVRGPKRIANMINFKPELPYGVALAIGALFALPGSVWLPA